MPLRGSLRVMRESVQAGSAIVAVRVAVVTVAPVKVIVPKCVSGGCVQCVSSLSQTVGASTIHSA